MAFLQSLDEDAHLYEVMKKMPAAAIPLFQMHDILLRGEEHFSVAEKELIATYTSGLNACSFCYRGHVAATKLFGIDEAVIDAVMDDIETAPVRDEMKPILRYVRKLTLEPSKMVQADADAVFAAGWSDEALLEAVNICALFCMMNRIADGAGVKADNTRTTLAKVKWDSYTENLINYGFEVPNSA
jgi:uncharacterized peroxidase-related enzyme